MLRTNVAQNITLSVDRWKADDYALTYARFMDWLEENADLDREISTCPRTSSSRPVPRTPRSTSR